MFQRLLWLSRGTIESSIHLMVRRRLLVAGWCVLLCSGCASIPPAQVGQTVGAILGSAIAPGIGAPLGALAGLLGGMLVQGGIDQATEKHERKTLGDQLVTGPTAESEASSAPMGAPTRVWVDEALQAGRLTAGHLETRAIP